MDPYVAEKCLAIFYPLIIGLSFIASVSSAIAWTHWKYVLNTCDELNCNCFLYGISSRTYFTGGHSAYCHFSVYGLILPVIFALIFGCVHVFRVCMSKGKRNSGVTTLSQRSGDMIIVTAQSQVTDDDISPYYWIPASVISAIMGLYALIYASIFTDGFTRSCYQYRNELTKTLQATGQEAEVIQGRLSCAAIFDFMDYLHGDSRDPRRIERINSAWCYYLAMLSAWFALFLWIGVCLINIMNARQSKQVRV